MSHHFDESLMGLVGPLAGDAPAVNVFFEEVTQCCFGTLATESCFHLPRRSLFLLWFRVPSPSRQELALEK